MKLKHPLLATLALSTLISSHLFALPTSISSQPSTDATLESCYQSFRPQLDKTFDQKKERNHLPEKSTSFSAEVTCADIFRKEYDQFLQNIQNGTAPNLFSKEFYDFLMDAETIAHVRKQLTPPTPVFIPIAKNGSTTLYQKNIHFDKKASALTLSDEQLKGFITHYAHSLFSLGGESTDDMCGELFINPKTSKFGCSLLAIKNQMNSEDRLIYIWQPGPDAEKQLRAWLVKDDYQHYAQMIAVLGEVSVTSTLTTDTSLLPLVGIPKVASGAFDPMAPIPDTDYPVIQMSTGFKSDCENLQPKEMKDIHCSTLKGFTKNANSMIAAMMPSMSGIKINASLAPTNYIFSDYDPAHDTSSLNIDFPAVLLRGDEQVGAPPMVFVNNRIQYTLAPEVTKKFSTPFLYEALPDDTSKYASHYGVHAVLTTGTSIIVKNQVELSDCDGAQDFYHIVPDSTNDQVSYYFSANPISSKGKNCPYNHY